MFEVTWLSVILTYTTTENCVTDNATLCLMLFCAAQSHNFKTMKKVKIMNLILVMA